MAKILFIVPEYSTWDGRPEITSFIGLPGINQLGRGLQLRFAPGEMRRSSNPAAPPRNS
jgi:hypothetical protein